MSRLYEKLKKLPAVLLAIFALASWLLGSVLPFGQIVVPWSGVAAIFVLLFALLIITHSALLFKIAKTTVDPRNPHHAQQLVTHGIYRYSRNPMYLGFLLILISTDLYLANWVCLLLLPPFVMLCNRMYIDREEEALRDNFGWDFEDYSKKVRRWL